MQIVERANPDGWAKEQPLKKRRAADIILLECSEALRQTQDDKKYKKKLFRYIKTKHSESETE